MLTVWVPILPEHIWSKISGKDAANKYANTPPFVGSGPFQCVEWKKNSYVKLVANPGYWRGAPTIQELYFDYYTNPDTMVQDLKAGTIDGATGLLDAQYRQLLNVPGIQARTINTNGFDQLGVQLLRRAQPRQPGAQGLEVPPGAQLGDRQGQDRHGLLRRSRRAGDDHHHRGLLHRPRLALGAADRRRLRLRPRRWPSRSSTRPATRTRRRRHPRLPGQAHRPAPVGALRVDDQPERQQAHRRLAQGRGPQDHAPDHGRRRAHRPDLRDQGRQVQPRLRPVPLGLVQRPRPQPDPELLHHRPDQRLERLRLVQQGVRPALRAAGRDHRPDRSARRSSTRCRRSSTASRRTSRRCTPTTSRPTTRQVGGLRGVAEQDRQRAVPALRPGRQRELPADPAQDGDGRRRPTAAAATPPSGSPSASVWSIVILLVVLVLRRRTARTEEA